MDKQPMMAAGVMTQKRDLIWLIVLTGAIALPFLNKPFHIDDPSVLQISANILENPLNPFAGFSAWFWSSSSRR